jgi:hypothetical protein
LREPFERLVAQAIEVELRIKYQHRFQAVDAWLDLLSRETRFSHGWKISLLLTASAECCEELKLGAPTTEQAGTAKIWAEIERQFRKLIAVNPNEELYAIDDRAGTPSTVESPDLKDPASGSARGPNRRADRQALVDAHIEKIFQLTGKRISRADIWRSAHYTWRTEFERWESCYYERRGKKPNTSAHQRFMRILIEKPLPKTFPALCPAMRGTRYCHWDGKTALPGGIKCNYKTAISGMTSWNFRRLPHTRRGQALQSPTHLGLARTADQHSSRSYSRSRCGPSSA